MSAGTLLLIHYLDAVGHAYMVTLSNRSRSRTLSSMMAIRHALSSEPQEVRSFMRMWLFLAENRAGSTSLRR